MTSDTGTARVALRGWTFEVSPQVTIWIVVDLVSLRAVAGGAAGSQAVARKRLQRAVDRLIAARMRERPRIPRSWEQPPPNPEVDQPKVPASVRE